MVQRNVVMAVLIVWISTNLAWAYDGKFEGFGATELLENAHTARAEKPSPKITDTSASTETMLAEAKEDVGDDDSEWTILDKRLLVTNERLVESLIADLVGNGCPDDCGISYCPQSGNPWLNLITTRSKGINEPFESKVET